MSQVSFVVNVPQQVAADIGSMIDVGNEVVRLVKAQLPIDNSVSLVHVLTANHSIVEDPTVSTKEVTGGAAGAALAVSGVLTTSVLLSVQSLNADPAATVGSHAGAAAGNVTMTGVTATSELKSVVGVLISDGTTVVDFTSEFTATAPNVINNGGGTNTSNYTLVATWHAVDSTTLTDLTSEFIITATGVIKNAGGTTTANKQVLVTWRD